MLLVTYLLALLQDSPLPVSLDDDMETLVDIGLIPGATILVDEM